VGLVIVSSKQQQHHQHSKDETRPRHLQAQKPTGRTRHQTDGIVNETTIQISPALVAHLDDKMLAKIELLTWVQSRRG
jgi:hypothetical protein